MLKSVVINNVPSTKIDTSILVNILFGVRGVTFVSAETTTIPDMNMGGRSRDNYMYDNVVKDSTVHCMIGFDYENRLNKEFQKKWVEDTIDAAIMAGISKSIIENSIESLKEYSKTSIEKIESKERKWGTHMINPTTGKTSRIMIHYIKKDKETGIEIPETYKRYMQVEVLGAKTPVYRYKDTGKVLNDADMACVKSYLKPRRDEPIIIRDYCVENIKKVRINKRQYIIES